MKIFLIRKFNVSDLSKLPLIDAIGYVHDEVSDEINMPLQGVEVFNLNELFVFAQTKHRYFCYYFYTKSLFMICLDEAIKNAFAIPPSYVIFVTESHVWTVDFDTKTNTIKYNKESNELETRLLIEYFGTPSKTMSLFYYDMPSIRPFDHQYVFQKENTIITLTRSEKEMRCLVKDKKIRYFFNEIDVCLETIISMFDIFKDLLGIFNRISNELPEDKKPSTSIDLVE